MEFTSQFLKEKNIVINHLKSDNIFTISNYDSLKFPIAISFGIFKINFSCLSIRSFKFKIIILLVSRKIIRFNHIKVTHPCFIRINLMVIKNNLTDNFFLMRTLKPINSFVLTEILRFSIIKITTPYFL